MAKKLSKSCPVSCRFTAHQYACFKDQWVQLGLKPARYFHDLVMSRLPTFEPSTIDKERMLFIFEKAGHALNRVAYLANSAPYSEVLYQTKYLRWLNRLTSIQLLLHSVIPTIDPPTRSRAVNGDRRGLHNHCGNKSHIVRFRLTQDEFAQFESLIKRAGCSVSVFFRTLILNKNPVFKEFTGFKKKIVFVVNKAGNNITQLAYIARSAFDRAIIDGEVRDKWLAALVTIEALLLTGIEYAD